MMLLNTLLAARNEAANKWLEEHPLVLGLIILTFGCVFAGLGAKALLTGESRDKYGNKLEGGMAAFQGIAFAIFGVIAILFGIYKMIAG